MCLLYFLFVCCFHPGPKVIKLFSCSAKRSLKFILLINVKMPKIVGILTFISRVIKGFRFLNLQIQHIWAISILNEKFKFYAQLS